jgi:hypothetical protein
LKYQSSQISFCNLKQHIQSCLIWKIIEKTGEKTGEKRGEKEMRKEMRKDVNKKTFSVFFFLFFFSSLFFSFFPHIRQSTIPKMGRLQMEEGGCIEEK